MWLDKVNVDHQTDTFMVDNAMMYQIFSRMFTDMDAFVYVKQRRDMEDGWAVFFNVHKLQYDPYEDKLQYSETSPVLDEEPEVTPEWGDQYMNAEILLPWGNKMTKGWVIRWKVQCRWYLIGRSNKKPMLDTRLYQVEFPGGEMTEFMANIIAESIYA